MPSGYIDSGGTESRLDETYHVFQREAGITEGNALIDWVSGTSGMCIAHNYFINGLG
jgi:hypothetical protein